MLSLVSALAQPVLGSDLFPLAVGNTWTYDIVEHTSAGATFFFLTGEGRGSGVVSEYTVKITGESSGKYTTTLTKTPKTGSSKATTSTYVLWEREGTVWMNVGGRTKPAIETKLPPNPVSAERVRCVSHLLGGVVGTCAPTYGGATLPGLQEGLVSRQQYDSDKLTRFVTGFLSFGVFASGDRSHYKVAKLRSFQPGEMPPRAPADRLFPLARNTPALLKEIAAGATLEETVQAAFRFSEDGGYVLESILKQAEPEVQYALTRAGVSRSREPLIALARCRLSLPKQLPEAQERALLAVFDSNREEAQWVINAPDSLFATGLAALPRNTSVTQATKGLLTALNSWLKTHTPTEKDSALFLGQILHSQDKQRAIQALIEKVPEQDRASAVVAWCKTMRSDSDRLKLVHEHHHLLQEMSASQRRALLQQFKDPADVVSSLSAARPRSESTELAVALERIGPQYERLERLRYDVNDYGLSVAQGVEVLSLFTNSNRYKAMDLLYNSFEPEQRDEALLQWSTTFTSNPELLRFVDQFHHALSKMSAAQQERVLKQFNRGRFAASDRKRAEKSIAAP